MIRWLITLRDRLRRFDPDRDPSVLHFREIQKQANNRADQLRKEREAMEARWEAEARASGNEAIELWDTGTVREDHP